MPGRSPPSDPPDLVVVAIAARGLAAAARRAGLRPIVLDLFGDEDTRALAVEAIPLRRMGGLAFDRDDLIEQLGVHAGGDLPVVLGSGFEDAPELVGDINRRFRLIGNGCRTLRLIKDPLRFAQLLADLGVPHPAVHAGPAPDGQTTLEKRIGGSGGWHVRPARAPRGEGWYLQELVTGRTVSTLFLGDGQRAAVLAFSEQWCEPAADAPYRYGGAVGPIELDPALGGEVAAALTRIVGATGLIGLASADLVVAEDGWRMIEINPRPGATLDVFDHPPLPPLFRLHLDACEGRLPDIAPLTPATVGTVRAASVFYAPGPLEVRLDPLPDWVADRPSQGTRIETGEPVCTLLAQGTDAADARRILKARETALWADLAQANRKAAE